MDCRLLLIAVVVVILLTAIAVTTVYWMLASGGQNTHLSIYSSLLPRMLCCFFSFFLYQRGDEVKARILSADISQQLLEVCVCEDALTL